MGLPLNPPGPDVDVGFGKGRLRPGSGRLEWGSRATLPHSELTGGGAHEVRSQPAPPLDTPTTVIHLPAVPLVEGDHVSETATTTLVDRHKAAAEEYLPQVRIIIGEEERTVGDGGIYHHINAATGQIQAEVPLAGVREIDEAVAAARRALGPWRAMNPGRRREILSRFAELMRAYDWTALQVLENGQTWSQAAGIALNSYKWVSYYATWADKLVGEVTSDNAEDGFIYTLPEPYGVVAMIITWNAPLLSLAMKLPPALAAGNTIVLKPAEFTAFTAMRWVELAREAGLPDGVINVVPGGPDAGEALVSHPGVDKISFTGGPPTARNIMRGAAENLTPVLFELGGKGANLVFADANLDEVLPFSCRFAMANTGQGCAIPTRMLVEDSIYDDVVARVEETVGAFTVGDPLDPASNSGPLVNEAALKRVLGVIEQARSEKAGRLLLGGERLGGELADGWFVDRTVFVDVDPHSDLAQHEIFGPVLSVIRFSDEAEAVDIANNTAYGLTNYIQTGDVRRIRRLIPQLRSGTIGVNTGSCVNHTAPFGGVGLSGFGREGGKAGIDEFIRVKTVLQK
jgi:aldehyde dehydrogenase (NAD+)